MDNEVYKATEKEPVIKLPCAECSHLRRPTSDVFAENYMICGWWEKQDWPIRGSIQFRISESGSSIPRKVIYDGPFRGQAVCKQFSQIEDRTND